MASGPGEHDCLNSTPMILQSQIYRVLIALSLFFVGASAFAGEALSERATLTIAQLGPEFSLPLPRFSGPSGGPMLLPPPPLDQSRGAASQCGSVETDWIVSSRCSRQDWCDAGSRGLIVYRRENGGCLQRSSLGEMYASLDPTISTAVFVHGSYVEFDWVIKESRATSKWLRKCRCGKPLQVVHYTWPSDEDARYLPCSVRELTRRAEFNAFYLADVLGCLPIDGSCGAQLAIVGHSHGAMMATAAMHLLGGGSVQGHTTRSRLQWKPNLILAAAAMDRDWLVPRPTQRTLLSLKQVRDRGRYDRAMCVTNQMLILRNRHDVALAFYPARRLFTRQALGKSGISNRDARSMGSTVRRIHEYDVTGILGCRHIWPYYLNSSVISCQVARYIQ